MTDIRARLKPLFRRTSTVSSAQSSPSSTLSPAGDKGSRSKNSLLLPKNRKPSLGEPVYEDDQESIRQRPDNAPVPLESQPAESELQQTPGTRLQTPSPTPQEQHNPVLILETPTPDPVGSSTEVVPEACLLEENLQNLSELNAQGHSAVKRPDAAPRRQSLAHSSQNRFLKTLLESDKPQSRSSNIDYFGGPPTISANMLHRKIWVKRPGASATLVSINEDDLVDDVRDMILKKYANSLGRSFDAPDVTLRIVPRDQSHRHSQGERTLGPEEPISRTLDAYFPGGQNVDEALLIDVPQRRTPRHSPRNAASYYLAEDVRPGESGTEYFPPMPAAGQHSPHLPSNLSATSSQSASHHPPVHSITILNSAHVPPLPSPNSRGPRHIQHVQHTHRPKYGRTNTSSPTIVTGMSASQNHGRRWTMVTTGLLSS